MKTELNNSTQTNKLSNPTPTPTPTLTLPLKGREIAMFLPLQGGGQEGDGVFVGVVLNLPYRKINGTHKISAYAGIQFFILSFPVFTGTSLDSRWSLPRTLIRGGNDETSGISLRPWRLCGEIPILDKCDVTPQFRVLNALAEV